MQMIFFNFITSLQQKYCRGRKKKAPLKAPLYKQLCRLFFSDIGNVQSVTFFPVYNF